MIPGYAKLSVVYVYHERNQREKNVSGVANRADNVQSET